MQGFSDLPARISVPKASNTEASTHAVSCRACPGRTSLVDAKTLRPYGQDGLGLRVDARNDKILFGYIVPIIYMYIFNIEYIIYTYKKK